MMMIKFRREALEAAISEKDAHLALLEMSGVRSARQADEMDRLRVDRRRLVDRLKREVDTRVSFIALFELNCISVGRTS